MAKISKRVVANNAKVDAKQAYNITEAINIIKDTANTKFDSTVEVAFNLNLDPTQAEQQLRGAMVLPHGSGKTSRILVFAEGDAAKGAEEAGADFVGSDEFVAKIKNENWFDFDVVVATPQMMPKIGRIGQILGPKGLMPNPKTGTVTPDVVKAVNEIKAGKITYRIDKFGNLHVIVGKSSFTNEQLVENLTAIYNEVVRIKPSTAKGTYIKNMTVTSSMGPGIKVEMGSIA
ncbi:50S ribosomal protein L1 [Mollicutes bacterium LVI A0039]|nr:50S ribosomal protein L1 [Mollicutes bacterium LVI A0039]